MMIKLTKNIAMAFMLFFASSSIVMPNFAMAQSQNSPNQAAVHADLSPSQEARFNKLALEIRCVVCQSEPVATSSAKIAADMRDVIKERILLGENDTQVRNYFASHYGEYVLLRPQFGTATIALWVAPFVLLGLGVFMIFLLTGKAKSTPEIYPNDDYELDAKNALDELEGKTDSSSTTSSEGKKVD